MRAKSWNDEPEKVVDAIKVMLHSDDAPQQDRKKATTIDEAIKAVKSPLNGIQKRLLKFLLPKGRYYVGRREWAKSWAIKSVEHVRHLYLLLAKKMVEMGNIPDQDLIFFMTPEEIETLAYSKNPKIIFKALRRRKIFTKFDNIKFPELCQGLPQPVKEEPIVRSGDKSFTMTGIAVGCGSIKGKARVVKTLAEANQIEHNEILIVPYTDVGWSPYFPMIGGLVTELGGLISHGAVVAREYGIPCLVGCKNATNLIETGDHVYIDGHKGSVEVTKM